MTWEEFIVGGKFCYTQGMFSCLMLSRSEFV